MVYKRYIKRKGRVFGPYYYESFRENGKVKSRLLKNYKEPEEKILKNSGSASMCPASASVSPVSSGASIEKSRVIYGIFVVFGVVLLLSFGMYFYSGLTGKISFIVS